MRKYLLLFVFSCSSVFAIENHMESQIFYRQNINTDDLVHERVNGQGVVERYKVSNDGKCLVGAFVKDGKTTLFLEKNEKGILAFTHKNSGEHLVLYTNKSECQYQMTNSKKKIFSKECGDKKNGRKSERLELDDQNRIKKMSLFLSYRNYNCHIPIPYSWLESRSIQCNF